MQKSTLSFAILIAVCWSILAREQESAGYFILKPLTTILIILLAFLSAKKENSRYHKALVIALCFCLAGDILLLKGAYFIFGLVSFLIAHLILIYAFTTINGFSRNMKPLLILACICVPYFLYLLPDLGNLAIPVAVYVTAIMTMSWQAIALYLNHRQQAYLYIAVAALSFMLSDSLLAYARFVQPFYASDVLIMVTYWAAIYLLAYSGAFVKTGTAQQGVSGASTGGLDQV